MKQYYLVRMSSEPSITGMKNGGAQAEIYRDGFQDKEMYDTIMKYWGSFDSWKHRNSNHGVDVELQCVKLQRAAKLTSFLSYGHKLDNCPFLISEDVKQVFENFFLPNYYLYNANVLSRGNNLKYYLFSCPDLEYTGVDFKKTIFFTGNDLLGKNYVRPESYEELKDIYRRSNQIVHMEKIFFDKNFDRNLDFFILGSNVFISENLKNEIEEKNFNGINILPAFGESAKWPIVDLG